METINHYALTFLLNSLWQVSLVSAVAFLASRLMLRGPASHRHAVWVAALAAGVLVPLVSTRAGARSRPMEVRISYAPITGAAPPPARAATPSALALASGTHAVPFGHNTAALVLAAYAGFLFFRFAKVARAWIRTVRICRAARACAAPPLLDRVWTRCLLAFGLKDVELLSSPYISSPLMTGAWRTTIILPEFLIAETSEDVLTTALGHEMAHIARRDFALNLLYELLYSPLAFHPAAWLVRRGIEQTREMASDELVTRRLMDPRAYARSIMSIAAAATGRPRPGYTLGVFDGDILEERIRRLLERPATDLRRARLLLTAGLSALALCAVIASSLAVPARAQSAAREEMKLAGDSYNRGDFQTAVAHFENAVHLEPANSQAKLFLANALLREFFSGHAQPDSPLLAAARQQYVDVLAGDPQNQTALQGMLAVAIDAGQIREAHDWALKLIQLSPRDKTAYYTAGLLDWSIMFPEYQRAKQAAGGKMEDYSIPDPAIRKGLRDQFLPVLEEGFQMLQSALQLDPEYDDAMAYLNLLYRLKSGLTDNPAEAAQLIAKADEWVGKALAEKRRHAHDPRPMPARLDVDGPAPGPAGAQTVVAGPPPPPPPPPPPAAHERPASAEPPSRPRNQVEQPFPFWQVMGDSDMPAIALFRLLKVKGFSAMMVVPTDDSFVRVLAGPYADAKSLDEAKAALAAAGFHPIRKW